LDTRLATAIDVREASMNVSGGVGVWQIAIVTREVRTGTLDQLDEAFQSGAIDLSTPVLAPGATRWSTLGELVAEPEKAPERSCNERDEDAIEDAPCEPAPVEERRTRRPLFPTRKSGLIAGAIAGLVVDVAIFGFAPSAPPKRLPVSAAAAVAMPDVAPAMGEPPPPARAEIATPPATTSSFVREAPRAPASPLRVAPPPAFPPSAAAPISTGVDPFASGRRAGTPCACAAGDPLCSCL
jgi:hypothetical protein